MRHRLLSFVVMFILILVLTFPAGAPAAPPAHNAQPAAAAPALHANPNATPEPHPEIREAIESLRRAKEHLEHASHDFGGHRVEAIKAIDEATHQLQDCLRYDR